MHVDLVWLTATLLSFPLITLCDPLYIMVAPQILRVGVRERVFVEVQDYQGPDPISVLFTVVNFPSKLEQLIYSRATLNSTNNFQTLLDIQIPYRETIFDADSKEKQFVYLKASFPGRYLEKLVMVSFQSGYIFLQTDKPIYTPDSTVKYRVFALNAEVMPVTQVVLVDVVTPDGITVERKQYNPGMKVEEYKLGRPISPGTWTIAARFKNNPQKNFTVEFEVKEYVLPSFEVQLKPHESFFYIEDEELSVSITAKYLFGKKLEGSAFVVFGVFSEGKKISIRSSLTRVDIYEGKGTAKVTRKQILETFPNIRELIGKRMYISVSVLTDTGSEMVESEMRGIHIVESPYVIHFTRTPKFFKPGLPFYLMVYVTNPDGTPAKDVEMFATPNSQDRGKTDANGLARFVINTDRASRSLYITVKTEAKRLTEERQAVNNMTAQAYTSSSTNYLHIEFLGGSVKVGDRISLTLHFGTGTELNQVITCLILSKGQIVYAQRKERKGNIVFAVPIDITKEMIPSFRVVAYYHVGSSEVVADSVWVNVTDTCMGTLQVTTEDARTYEPTNNLNLKITGNSGANVNMVAVDKGIYVLNNKNRLTQAKIWDTIEKHDIACTAGSGGDSMGVFYDAGLMFTSDSGGSTADRRDFSCPTERTRQRRGLTVAQLRRTLVHEHNETLKQCCADGMVENQLGYTCERRAEYVEDGVECREAFLHCCQRLTKLKEEVVLEELHLARSEDIELDPDEYSEESSRSVFPESWMMDVIQLPACKNNKCVMSDIRVLPESITTWVITAISMSQDYGICVADPHEVSVTMKFFIDLKLPYSAVVSEQIQIKAILHNLSDDRLEKVYVELKETASICSMASFKHKYRTSVRLDSKSSRAVSFIIVPLAMGEFSIEVKAFTPTGQSDGVRKTLKVVSQGLLTSIGEETRILEPAKYGGEQRSEIKRAILKDQMPGTDAYTYIAVTGRPLAQLINDAISGQGLYTLIKEPSGCGEQNLLAMVLPVIATHYLDKTNKWSDVGVDQRFKTLSYISKGYANELAYRKADSSFAIFSHRPGSTWLTAYVVRIFSMAGELIVIEKDVVCDAIKWLSLKTQMPNGVFTEVESIASSAMGGKATKLTMTAFVLIALQEGNNTCSKSVKSLESSMEKALRYIDENIHSTSDPYAAAIASYALAKAGKLKHDVLLRFASEDVSHWPVGDSRLFTLEATGYALLSLVTVGDFSRASPIVNWLKTNQRFEGAFQSTQATAVVFEALAKYIAEKPTTAAGDMNVIVSSSARSRRFNVIFTKATRGIQRSDKFQATGDLTVIASGHGEGAIRVITQYYTRPDKNHTRCNSFELDVKMTRAALPSYDQALTSYTLTIKTKFLNKEKEAAMTILEVGMLTGFVPDTSDLQKLMGKDKYIEKFETDKLLSERGSLIIYLKRVSNRFRETIAFKVHQMLDIDLPQPAGITIYEYYDTENRCVKFYDTSTERTSGLLYTLCPTEVCTCAEENCPRLKAPDVPGEDTRNNEACSNKDYVYKATLKEVKKTFDIFTIYTFTIVKVLKEGTDRNVVDQMRDFSVHHRCWTKLGLVEGKSYLIMGPEPQKVGTSYRYMFSARTWIEYWPTSAEGQEKKDNNNLRYRGMLHLDHIFQEGGGCMT